MAKGKNKLNKTNSSGWLDDYSEELSISQYEDGGKLKQYFKLPTKRVAVDNTYNKNSPIGNSSDDKEMVNRLLIEKVNNARKAKENEDAKKYVEKDFKESVDFFENYYNSPRYKEMLKNSTNLEDVYNEQRIDNLRTTAAFSKNNDEGNPNSFGYSNSYSGDISILPAGRGDKYTMTHELSHSSDRPYIYSLPNELFRDLGLKTRFNPTKSVLKNVLNIGTTKKGFARDRVIPYLDEMRILDNQKKFDSKFHLNKNNINEEDFKSFYRDYVGEPTEVRARLMEIRRGGLDNNIYNPFKEKVTPENYKKLKDYFYKKDDIDSPIFDLEQLYDENKVIKFLNEISENKEEDTVPMAKNGGEINQYEDGGIIDTIKEFFTEKTNKPAPKSAPAKSSPKTFKIEDKRKVLATSGQPIRPNVDITSGEYDLDVLKGIIESAKRKKLPIEDVKNLAAIAFQETKFGKTDENLGHVSENFESRSDLEALTNAYITKMKEADRLGIKDEAKRLQVYNGLKLITPDTEKDYHGFKMKKIYGVPVPKEGINMKKNPLYGKQIMDLRDNVLNQNPEYVNYLNTMYNSKDPVPVYSDVELKSLGPPPLLGKFAYGGKINNDMKKKLKKYPAGGYLDYQEGYKGFGVGPQLYQDNSYFRSIMPDNIENIEEQINEPSVFSGINDILGAVNQGVNQATGLLSQFSQPKMGGNNVMPDISNWQSPLSGGKTDEQLNFENDQALKNAGLFNSFYPQKLPTMGPSMDSSMWKGVPFMKNGGYLKKYQDGGSMDMLPVGSPEYIHKSNVFHENYNPVPRVHFSDDTTPYDMGVNLNDLVNMNGGRINKYQNGGDMSLQGYFNYLTNQNQNRVPLRAFNANTNRASLGALEAANANDFLNTKVRKDRQSFEDDKVDWGFMDWAKEPVGALTGVLSTVPIVGDITQSALGDSFLTRTGGYAVGKGVGNVGMGAAKVIGGAATGNIGMIGSGIGDVGEGVGSTVGTFQAKDALSNYDKSGYVSGNRMVNASQDFGNMMDSASGLFGNIKGGVGMVKNMGGLKGMLGNMKGGATGAKGLGNIMGKITGIGFENGGYLNNYQEGGMVSMPEDFEIPKFKKGGLTPKKAREILHDKSVHGNPLTDKQRKYFGYISSQKKSSGGWLDEL